MLRKIFLLLVFSLSSLFAQDNFRVMTYNILNYPSKIASERNPYFKKVIEAANPDILIVQEIESINGVTLFLEQVLDTNYTAGGFIDGYTTDNAIFFKHSKFEFIDNTPIKTALRDISQLTMVYKITNDTLLIYSAHLKASTGSVNEQKRLAEVTNLRAVTDKLPEKSYYILVGDLNVYSASEPAFQKLLNQETSGYFLDPIYKLGNWHDNSAYRGIHTQSTRTINLADEGSTSGLDDRFDMILVSRTIVDSGGITYIPKSYTTFGNDGNHFNRALNELPNASVSDEIAEALYYSSDHLPVYADFSAEPITSTEFSGNFSSYDNFELSQNYPNPFNPTTTISYTIPYKGESNNSANKITLKVFNILGLEIKTLIDDYKSAGKYKIDFNANNLSSGVYFYTLRYGNNVITKKMIYLR